MHIIFRFHHERVGFVQSPHAPEHGWGHQAAASLRGPNAQMMRLNGVQAGDVVESMPLDGAERLKEHWTRLQRLLDFQGPQALQANFALRGS